MMQMIEADKFWHQKTFDSVLTDLQRKLNKGIHEQEDISMYLLKTLKSLIGCPLVCGDQYALVHSLSHRIASLHVSFTAYEYFYKTI